jgi:thiol-disulfide isomerase/thioredoxin
MPGFGVETGILMQIHYTFTMATVSLVFLYQGVVRTLSATRSNHVWIALLVLSAMAILCACNGAASDSSTAAAQSTPSTGVLPPTPTTVPLFTDTGLIDPLNTVPEVQLVGIKGWVNSPELDLKQLSVEGRVVLLDFWTYTCVNCVRTFPFLRAMHDRYSEFGLTIIGIHSPEFEFEKITGNVEQAVVAAGLTYPIALDSDRQTWDHFNNHFWPTSYLIGADGEVRYRHFGEGGYEETERQIRQALQASGADVSGVPVGGEFQQSGSEMAFTQTREIYAGYTRGFDSSGLFAGQDAYYLAPDATVDYVDSGLRRHGQFELSGRWRNESDAIAYAGSAGNSGYVVFPFFATSVNAVMSPGGAGATVIAELDGGPIPASVAGPDITYTIDGQSVLVADLPRMYRLLESAEFGRHELKLTTGSEQLRIHNFTFGIASKGP